MVHEKKNKQTNKQKRIVNSKSDQKSFSINSEFMEFIDKKRPVIFQEVEMLTKRKKAALNISTQTFHNLN